MTLWGGGFSSPMDPGGWKLNTSLSFDIRLAQQDIRCSQAWARALRRAEILTESECTLLVDGLQSIGSEFELAIFQYFPNDEDIHTAVERRLGELVGSVAGKLHTGRSRNDQVTTDFRLWFLDNLPGLDRALTIHQRALIQRAETDFGILVPGYTHLQRAQPILLSHWWLSHFWPIQRDRQRLRELTARISSLPLGSSALAGTPYPIDRDKLAEDLGFASVSPNSLDAVSDRDFAAEFLFCAALIGTHLSRFSEAIILFTSSEFGFLQLSDPFSTGSSLMPQKKNPDLFELARGKSGTLLGIMTGFLATLKGLPSAYDKDLQEDKIPAFQAYDTLIVTLPVLANAIETLVVNPQRMRSAISAVMMATDLADYLVMKGIPFREAHNLTGKAVQRAKDLELALDCLPLEEYSLISPVFDRGVFQCFDPNQSIARRASSGGTAPQAVLAQLEKAKASL